jgi:SEC-C motif-containing protein
MQCPCGSQLSYDSCCGRYHVGAVKPETAEQLMRSRYSAYANGNYEYIVKTTHPKYRNNLNTATLKADCDKLTWLRLEVLDSFKGTKSDKIGKVEFKAYYVEPATGPGVIHERSRFKRQHGEWLYLDGQFSD